MYNKSRAVEECPYYSASPPPPISSHLRNHTSHTPKPLKKGADISLSFWDAFARSWASFTLLRYWVTCCPLLYFALPNLLNPHLFSSHRRHVWLWNPADVCPGIWQVVPVAKESLRVAAERTTRKQITTALPFERYFTITHVWLLWFALLRANPPKACPVNRWKPLDIGVFRKNSARYSSIWHTCASQEGVLIQSFSYRSSHCSRLLGV